jgi:hypothetical protein
MALTPGFEEIEPGTLSKSYIARIVFQIQNLSPLHARFRETGQCELGGVCGNQLRSCTRAAIDMLIRSCYLCRIYALAISLQRQTFLDECLECVEESDIAKQQLGTRTAFLVLFPTLADETEKWGKVVKFAGAKVD